jgi:hypothetical protein
MMQAKDAGISIPGYDKKNYAMAGKSVSCCGLPAKKVTDKV